MDAATIDTLARVIFVIAGAVALYGIADAFADAWRWIEGGL